MNLRAPFYSAEVLEESLELATVVKMNDAEAPLVLDLLDLAVDEASAAAIETASTGAELFARSRRAPARGVPCACSWLRSRAAAAAACLVTRDEWDEHPGFPVKVADGIGAGDAFTAAMTHYLLRGADLATLNEAGNRWGGWMASQSGAMPALPDAVRDAIAAAIERTS